MKHEWKIQEKNLYIPKTAPDKLKTVLRYKIRKREV